ncbi:B12-binding domain-containing radical SAM protein, partial [Bradyrhizobium sp.]|uniref:B12-binding domain-containing radical SAM protein n=1 Tax=Bradyrhizobium sp. TaxID=376 RepID=UPI003C24A879
TTFRQFDVIVKNEAEETIVSVVESLKRGTFEGVPGISFVSNGTFKTNSGNSLIANLDNLPIPAYHRYPIMELGLTSLRVDAGRGCPFQCTFCSTASFFGRQYRLKSADRLRRELDHLNAIYGVSDFSLTHDLFTVNRRKVLEFCDAVEGRGYTWKCSARQDCVDDELLARMRKSGCTSIYYGIEAGSERMQKISKKKLDLGIFEKTLSTTQRLGMSATVSFITGYPEETKADQDATLELIGSCFDKDLSPLNVQLHLLTPEPGTALLTQYQNDIAYDGHISDFNFPTLELDDGTVISSYPQVFINHHYFPAALPRDRHIFVTTIYQHLYGLGFPLLRYVLRQFRRNFANLIDAMDDWRTRRGRSPQADQCTVEDFFGDRFGRSHHIAGLVRYMLQATELRRRSSNELLRHNRRSNGDEPSLSLSSRSALVLGVPDCSQILELLSDDRASSIPSDLLSRRYDFLLCLSDHDKNHVVNFKLNKPSVAAFSYLFEPRCKADWLTFETSTGYPAPPEEFLMEYLARGVLEVAGDTLAS